MKQLFITAFLLLMATAFAFSQGCIIVRNISGFSHYNFKDYGFSSNDWVVDLTGRYFRSYRDFKGSNDLKTPAQDRSINKVFTFDFTATRILQKGWALSLNIPVTANKRSATVEHGGAGTPRHATHSFGLGDMRMIAYKWLITPRVKQKSNVQLGLGIKLPTGDFRYQDYFYRNDSTAVLAPVNPSVQLGDGGTGIVTELNTYYILNKSFTLYGNFYYLINPREQNGVSPLVGRTPSVIDIKSGRAVNSVPDQYTARVGINYGINKVAVSAGWRAYRFTT
jgi:hypothetical protein